MAVRRAVLKITVPNKPDNCLARMLYDFKSASDEGRFPGIEVINETEDRPGDQRDLVMKVTIPLADGDEYVTKLLGAIGYGTPEAAV